MPNNPLAAFVGPYGGLASSGFSAIFRPNSAVTPTVLPRPVESDNILQLSVIREFLRFLNTPGLLGVPVNRGSGTQGDITLVPVFYDQYVEDLNIMSSAQGAVNSVVHQELGMWVVQPPTEGQGPRVQRLAAIQHGVSMVAEGTYTKIAGKPTIPPVSMVPFRTDTGEQVPAPALQAAATDTARLPQDPATLAKQGITQAVLDDPNKLLRDKIANQKIASTIVLEVDTDLGGVVNTDFLLKNAACTRVRATFYIETMERRFMAPAPQIQYFQEVFLEFGGVTYPHVTVATIGRDPFPVPVII